MSVKKRPQATASRKRKPVQTRNKGQSRGAATRSHSTANGASKNVSPSRSRAATRDKKGQARANAQTRHQSEASQRFSANLQGAAKDGVAIAMLAVCAFLLLAFFSYSPTDPGWSSSGPQQAVGNWMGNGGAWLADVLFSLLGDAALWLPAILGFAGWRLLQKRIAHYEWDPTALAVRIIGLAMVLAGSCIIAYLHFDSSNSDLPYKDGGIIGQGMSQLIGGAIGVYGATLVALALLLGGVPMMTNCSWLTIMDKLGKGITCVLGFVSGKLAAAREGKEARRLEHEDTANIKPSRRAARSAEEEPSEPARLHGATLHSQPAESWWSRLTARLRGGKGVDIRHPDHDSRWLPEHTNAGLDNDPLFARPDDYSRDIPWDEVDHAPSRRTRADLDAHNAWSSLDGRGEAAYQPVDEPPADYREVDEPPADYRDQEQFGQRETQQPEAQPASESAQPYADVTRRRIPAGYGETPATPAGEQHPAAVPESSSPAQQPAKPRVRVGANGSYASEGTQAGAAALGAEVASASFSPAADLSKASADAAENRQAAAGHEAASTESPQKPMDSVQTMRSADTPARSFAADTDAAPAVPDRGEPQAAAAQPSSMQPGSTHMDARQDSADAHTSDAQSALPPHSPAPELSDPVPDAASGAQQQVHTHPIDEEPQAVGPMSALDDDEPDEPDEPATADAHAMGAHDQGDDVSPATPEGTALFADQPAASDDELAAAQPIAPQAGTPPDAAVAPAAPAPVQAEALVPDANETSSAPRVWTVEQLQNQGAPLATGEPVGKMPTTELLTPADDAKPSYTQEQLDSMGEMLETRLKEYGVKAEVVNVSPGPVITRFEIEPAPGVKSSKISNLSTDLARSLRVKSVRVIEVIQGRSTVGIEIPNPTREMIRLRQVLESAVYRDASSPITVALGQSISGQPIVADLGKMPHVLVAGTTGSGKSVGVNAMLISMLLKSTPEEVRMILIDPKMLELSVYDDIPHLLAPVVTDMKEAANSLRWCVAEMERRYKLMSKMGVRNIAGFNAKLDEAHAAGAQIADPLWDPEPWQASQPQPMLEKLPYIVVVIDEFADMFMVVGKKVEELIARLAQKARAAGIHLVLATQRPSVDVVTGLIKANIPSRIAFQVSSKTDSRTILDQGGAESLLGHGDMLYLAGGSGSPVRVHGAFVDDNEVHRVVEDWRIRGKPDYVEEILSGNVNADALAGLEADSEGGNDAEQDALYDEAVAFVTEKQKVSVSSVQRNFKIGYNRASRLVEAMEHAGVVSEMGANGGREVLARAAPRD